MQDHLEGLNPKQRQAAVHTDGPLLIVAGAGAGKTKTIVHRIVNLVKQGVEPGKVLAVTFTNKAAKEMRERVEKEFEKSAVEQNGLPFVSTFHSLGVFIIKENAQLIGLTKHFSILDDGDTNSMIKGIMKGIGIDPKQYDPKRIKGAISREKGKFVKQRDYAEGALNSGGYGIEQMVARVWERYEIQKKKENSLDFDDLLVRAVELLEGNPEVRAHYQNKWSHIHIDEYQDTNEVQYLMSKILAEKSQNICAVGDADQNIYSWRGANLKNILSFERDYKNTTTVMLEQNYRSTQNILAAANEIIKKNQFRPEKNLFTKKEEGDKLSLYEALDESDEAEFVATKILELRDAGVTNLSEVAVLYRANFQSRILEEAMLRYNIPYQVLGVKFFERKEIKDTLAYLRAALNKESLSDIKRIINFPKRGIGKVSLVKIFAGESSGLPIKMQLKLQKFYELLDDIRTAISEKTPSEVIKYVIKKSGIESELLEGGEEEAERLENIKELATLALKYDNLENGAGIDKLLEDAALASDQDSLVINRDKKTEVNAVKLMTVHAAKGLEFNQVFIVGMEDGLFPNQRAGEVKNAEDSEEERRLFYVALTRARVKVYLSFANYRTIFGSKQINAPSEFLSDISNELIERERGNILKTIYL